MSAIKIPVSAPCAVVQCHQSIEVEMGTGEDTAAAGAVALYGFSAGNRVAIVAGSADLRLAGAEWRVVALPREEGVVGGIESRQVTYEIRETAR